MRRTWLHGKGHDGVRRTLLSLLGALLVLGAAGGLAPFHSDARADGPPFKIAPEILTFDVHGNSRALSHYLNAKPILLEFMALNCPHCLEMAPILTRVHTVYGERVQFLTVAFDKNARRVQQFAQL